MCYYFVPIMTLFSKKMKIYVLTSVLLLHGAAGAFFFENRRSLIDVVLTNLNLFLTVLGYFRKYYAKIGCVHVFRAAFGRALAGGFHPPDPPICSFFA